MGLFQSEPKWMNANPRKAQKALEEVNGISDTKLLKQIYQLSIVVLG